MRYYVVSDVHGFYKELLDALNKSGFFTDSDPHKLVIIGDLMDRGTEAKLLEEFIVSLMEQNLVVLIKGNHEDLLLDLINRYSKYMPLIMSGYNIHHLSNKTFDTALQLSECTAVDSFLSPNEFIEKVRESPFVKQIIPACVDYFETSHYIFTHGWLPIDDNGQMVKDLSCATLEQWEKARWYNGMEYAMLKNYIINDKTVVCGHIHTSYGHARISGICSEYGDDAIFTPFYGKGIIAIDSCVVHTGFINCIIIED